MNASSFIKETQYSFDGKCLGLQPSSIYKYMLKFETQFQKESAGVFAHTLQDGHSFYQILNQESNKEMKFLKYRRMLIDWMFELGESLGLLPRTCHTAAVMVDMCFTRHSFEKKIWQTLSISCLALAAKQIEKDERKHYLQLLIDESKLSIERKSVVQVENQVMILLDWKITNFSVRHFLESLLCSGFVTCKDRVYSFLKEDDKAQVHQRFNMFYPQETDQLEAEGFCNVLKYEKVFDKIQKVNDKILRYLRKYACFFGDLCVQHVTLMKHRFALLGATCLAASRKALNMAEIWTEELEASTKYSWAAIEGPLNELWAIYEEGYKREVQISWRCSFYRNADQHEKEMSNTNSNSNTKNTKNSTCNVVQYD